MNTSPAVHLSKLSSKKSDVAASVSICVDSSASVLYGVDEDRRSSADTATRFHQLFEHCCDKLSRRERRKRIAVEYPDESHSYAELEAMSNRIACLLRARGTKPGDRIALLLDRSLYSYAAILAVSKVDAIYVPLDFGFPVDRIRYIVEDSSVSLILTLSQYVHLFDPTITIIALDAEREALEKLSTKRVTSPAQLSDVNPLCYIIYTSGTTGHPKGVAVRHASICNFLQVALPCYGFEDSDRVYQGLTMAFDYSFEEIWLPLLTGATLVPAPTDVNLLGSDLADFLIDRQITALCCVPTLLSSIEIELPALRFLMVSGEACSQDLADRWNIPGRRFVNTYGPTETTVSATWSTPQPGTKLTIGEPLPSYSVVIASTDSNEVVPRGSIGEICIGGMGLADGYINLPEKTEQAFVPDFAGVHQNPSGRLYRTGDLGRITAQNTVECLGRIDNQVKIRGYRIELDEIESVARGVCGVALAVVNPYSPDNETTELSLYFTQQMGAEKVNLSVLHETLRKQLPAYMVPAFYEELESMPRLPSSKVDRNSLPVPRGSRYLASGRTYIAPQPGFEEALASSLAELLKVERVSADANFFDDLGANSLLMARYLAKLRKQQGITSLSMKLIYQNPTIQALGNTLQPEIQPVSDSTASASVDGFETSKASAKLSAAPMTQGKGVPQLQYILCGLLQSAYYFVELMIIAGATIAGYHWVDAALSPLDLYLRATLCGALLLIGVSGILLAVKWMAIGRFTSEVIPLWSLRYVRFWIAKSAVQTNPMNLFIGTSFYNVYLRLLGAKIGRDTTILTRVPICTDLVNIGENSVVRPDCFIQGYTVRDGQLFTGSITIGSNAFVGDATVLEINSSVGDNAQLGTSSALLEGHHVPNGETYQGSPAESCTSDFNRVPALARKRYRSAVFSAGRLMTLIGIVFPVPLLLLYLLPNHGMEVLGSSGSGEFGIIELMLAYSAIVYFGAMALNLVVVVTLPRLLNYFVKPGKPFPLFGIQYFLAHSITRLSNSRVLNTIFGDSSMIVYYLKAIGFDLSESTQTGSNFGVNQRHHSPFLCKFSRNTLVSDGLMILNMETSATSFQLNQVSVAPDNYLGNLLHFPANSKVGSNCLIATKAMVPIDGPIRKDVGILGSPPFEIPRSVMSDRKFDHYKRPGVIEKRLSMKLRSNLLTLGIYCLRNWSELFFVMLFYSTVYHQFSGIVGSSLVANTLLIALITLVSIVFAPAYSILFERLVLHFHPIKPTYCSLYDRDFWLHERFWKLNYNAMLVLFNGTPMKAYFLRLQGAKVGQQVFDDGAAFTEPSLVEVGDRCCFNYQVSIQCHSLEDGTFKSDKISIGTDCNVAVRGFVHYGCHLDDGSTLQADAFLMKGLTINSGEAWLGNPARPVSDREGDARTHDQRIAHAIQQPVCHPVTAQEVSLV